MDSKKVDELVEKFEHALTNIKSSVDLQSLKVEWLGKKGVVKGLTTSLKSYPTDEKAVVAKYINDLKRAVEEGLEQKRTDLVRQELDDQIDRDWIDWSLPGFNSVIGATHPLSRIEKRCIDVLGLLGFKVADGPEIEDAFHNFDALNIPEDHPARDMQDTYWIEGGLLLRSHTSTVQIRVLSRETEIPIKVVAPGKVYRNEAVDATHLANFHQFEGLWVDEGVSFDQLKGTLDFIIEHVFGSEWEVRYKPKFYPYTEPSIGVDIRRRGTNESWITVLGGGMVHPSVFTNTGHDPNKVSGFAFGLGLSRIVTMAYGVTNMKSLYEGDLRVHQQLVRPE